MLLNKDPSLKFDFDFDFNFNVCSAADIIGEFCKEIESNILDLGDVNIRISTASDDGYHHFTFDGVMHEENPIEKREMKFNK